MAVALKTMSGWGHAARAASSGGGFAGGGGEQGRGARAAAKGWLRCRCGMFRGRGGQDAPDGGVWSVRERRVHRLEATGGGGERLRAVSGAGMDRPVKRRFPRWFLPALATAAGVIGLALLLWAFWPEGGRVLRIEAGLLRTARVTTGTFEDFIPLRGTVVPAATVFLDAVEGGRVEQIFVEDGARVEKGQLLVRLSNPGLQLEVIAREADVTEQLNNLRTLELQFARNALEHERNLVEIDYQITRLSRLAARREALVKTGAVSRQDYEQTMDELAYWRRRREVTLKAQESDRRLQQAQIRQQKDLTAQLERNLALARRNLAALEVRAPVAGLLTAFDLQPGQSLSPGTRIGQIDDPDHFKLQAAVDEFYLPRVEVGQRAELEFEGRDYALRLKKIYPQVRSGQFLVDFVFEGAPPAGIRRGQSLPLKLTLSDPEPALLIPNGPFYQDTGGNWIFVVTPDGRQAVKRSVRLGRRNARYIEVLEGLSEGEEVVISSYAGFAEMDRLELEKGGAS